MTKKIYENWREFLAESSLTRLHKHMMEHDSAIITCFRGERSKEENYENNRVLKAVLLKKGFGVTKVKGSYIENFTQPTAMEVSEASLFVSNRGDDPDFANTLKVYGEEYGQDSVLIIPQGAKGAYLIGTREGNDFPPYGKTIKVGDLKMGEEEEFMTKVKNRPFAFKEDLETYDKLSKNSKWAVSKLVEETRNRKLS